MAVRRPNGGRTMFTRGSHLPQVCAFPQSWSRRLRWQGKITSTFFLFSCSVLPRVSSHLSSDALSKVFKIQKYIGCWLSPELSSGSRSVDGRVRPILVREKTSLPQDRPRRYLRTKGLEGETEVQAF